MANLNMYSDAATLFDQIKLCNLTIEQIQINYPTNYYLRSEWKKYTKILTSLKKELEELKETSQGWAYRL